MAAEFQLIKSETLPLTDELLQEFSGLPGGPTERLFKEARVTHLTEKILGGNAIPFIWATAEMGDKKFRMNGYHSSTMLNRLDGNRPSGLMVHMDTYRADDKQGLVRLFRQFDDRKSSRDAADVSGAFQMCEDALIDLDPKVAKRAIEGVAWYDWNIEGVKTLAGDDRYTLFHETAIQPFLLWCGIIYDMKTKEMEEVAITSAMWATWTRNKDAAEEFWKLVAHGGGEFLNDENHPTTKLDDWLKAAHGKNLQQKKIVPGEYYNGCVFCWNAWRRSDAGINKIRYDSTKGFYDVLE